MSRLNIPEELNHRQNGCDEVRSRMYGENHKQIFWNLTAIRFRKDRKYDKTFTKWSTDCTLLAQRAMYNKNALAPSNMSFTFPLTITFYTLHFIMNFFLAFFLSFFLSFDLLLPTHLRCKGYRCIWSHSDTPRLIRLLWTRDRPVVEISTWQHTTFTRDRYPWPGQDSNPKS